MDGRAKRERPRGVESNPRRGDGRSTSDSHGGGNGGSDGYSRGSGRGGSHGDSHGHRHGHSRGPNPGPDRGLTYCDARGNIAASNTALLAAPLRPKTRRQSRQHCGAKHGVNCDTIAASNTATFAASRPQTRRQSRQHCGFKYGVNRDLIAASSLPHRGVKFGVNHGRDRGRRFPFSVRRRPGRTTVRFLAGSGWSRACGWRGRQGDFWPRTRRLRVLRPDLPRP